MDMEIKGVGYNRLPVQAALLKTPLGQFDLSRWITINYTTGGQIVTTRSHRLRVLPLTKPNGFVIKPAQFIQ